MEESEIVLLESSPHRNLEAVVEQDDRVAYFYLKAPRNGEFGLKSCWVRNLAPAPKELDVAGMREGLAPMLPRAQCAFPEGQPRLEKGRLSLVWFPEGDGVALLEDGKFLAAIPPWSGIGDFAGYARDCVGQSTLCWDLDDPAVFENRIAEAQQYWATWDEASLWPRCQEAFMAAYESVLGPHARYFAIDGGVWPPKALIRVESGGNTFLLTLGISLCPQPRVEMHYNDPADFRRFEFAACFAGGTEEATISQFARYLSAQSALPWERFTFFGHGHTVPCDAFEKDPRLAGYASILLLENPAGAPDLNPPRMGGEKVSLLWAVPITTREREMAEEVGSKELLQRFPSGWPLHVIGPRPPVLE